MGKIERKQRLKVNGVGTAFSFCNISPQTLVFKVRMCFCVLNFPVFGLFFVHSSPSPNQRAEECWWWGFPRVCACLREDNIPASVKWGCAPAGHLRPQGLSNTPTHIFCAIVRVCCFWDKPDWTSTTCCSACVTTLFYTGLIYIWMSGKSIDCTFTFFFLMLSYLPSFSLPFDTTQRATGEKVISDWGLYWD